MRKEICLNVLDIENEALRRKFGSVTGRETTMFELSCLLPLDYVKKH